MRFGLAMASALVAGALMTVTAGAQEKRELGYSFNVAITSDYVFRGFSQSAERPTGQAGIDLTWGKLYAGAWGSGINFGNDTVSFKDTAKAEVDLYAGVKPEWGGFAFDFGFIYYMYPGALDHRTTTLFDKEANYLEIKAGVSRELIKDKLTLGSTLFWSPDYTNSTGSVWTSETQATLNLPDHGILKTSLSALYGYQSGNSDRYKNVVGVANGASNYSYWNAGVTFGLEKFSLDLRYWDTNVKNDGLFTGYCNGPVFACDQRFVGTFKFTY